MHDDDLLPGERRVTTLAEAMAAQGTRAERIAPEDDIAELVACLPTATCLRMLQNARTRLQTLQTSHGHPQAISGTEDKIRYWDDRVRVAYQRDQRVMERQQMGPEYSTCFCLGQGGAGDLMVAGVPNGRGEHLAAVVDGQQVQTWERVCACPDGEQHRLSVFRSVETAKDALRAARVAKIAGAAGIPALYADLTVLSWTQAVEAAGGAAEDVETVMNGIGQWQDHCRELLTERPRALNSSGRPGFRMVPRLLYLFGNHGTGKSGLAAALAQRWIEQERSVLYRTVAQISAELRASPYRHQRGEDQPTEYELLQAFMDCDLLVIDDLGSESASFINLDKAREALFLILDARMTTCRPTIVTTNLNYPSLVERYGSRISERLVSPQLSVLVAMVEPNLRMATGS